MSDANAEGLPASVEYRAVIDFSVDPNQTIDPEWRGRVLGMLSGLGAAAGLEVVSVGLERIPTELDPTNPRLLTPIAEVLGTSDVKQEKNILVRSLNCLTRDGFLTAGDVLAAGSERARDIRNMGDECVKATRAALKRLGFEWEATPDKAYMTKIFERPTDVSLSVALNQLIKGLRTVGDVLRVP